MLRQLPNLLSGARLLASPVLAALAFMQQETVFTWVLIPALLSDILDGLIARMFALESRLGAILDSVADTLLMLVSCYGIWVFHPEVIREHAWLCGTAIGLWLLEDVLALAALRAPVELPHLPVENRRQPARPVHRLAVPVRLRAVAAVRGRRRQHPREPRGTRAAAGTAAVARRRARPVVGAARRLTAQPAISGSSSRLPAPCRPAAGNCRTGPCCPSLPSSGP